MVTTLFVQFSTEYRNFLRIISTAEQFGSVSSKRNTRVMVCIGVYSSAPRRTPNFCETMEELKDVSIHHMALKILSDITNLKKYDENIFRTVQVLMGDLKL